LACGATRGVEAGTPIDGATGGGSGGRGGGAGKRRVIESFAMQRPRQHRQHPAAKLR